MSDAEELARECKIHGMLDEKQIYVIKRKSRKKADVICILCKSRNDKKYSVKNKDKKKSYMKQWVEKNRKQVNYKNRKNWKTIKDKINKGRAEKVKKEVIEISDNYIKGLVARTGELKYSEVPQEIIDIKKILLQLKRKLWELKNGN